ncbi:MAG: hypothetical protein V4581_02130 [Bacteroidota bacterium]
MKTLFASLTLLVLFTASEISMLSIKIGSPAADLEKIKLTVEASEDGMTKYRTENGNDFSVTVEDGKVVFMENDWLQDVKGTKPLVPGFTFGTTSLKDIRAKFGTNGFVHNIASSMVTDTHVIMLNCFELDSPNNEILVTITKVSKDADATEENVASLLKLDALIIADKNYLDKIWGEEKVYDPNNKKVKL